MLYPTLLRVHGLNPVKYFTGAWPAIQLAFVSIVGSAATAGLTGATVMLTLTLSTLGLPLEGVGLLLAIDPILDMGRTAVNVAGQALVPTIVAKREGILDLDRYNGARGVGRELDPEHEEQADRPVDLRGHTAPSGERRPETMPARQPLRGGDHRRLWAIAAGPGARACRAAAGCRAACRRRRCPAAAG